ncbi:competence protein ComEC [Daejeonella rubra]|uniref:Competence protein ComEC n=1 Tax=Daejeonella rubra TaxID=990371 RepID=A0A1G9M527_9SPHI|nr:ComEC/Rec2 family competence protein [Daejeonella rubra]SDL69243.1 competence protein ComEC [Daejeonella rubra]
MFFKGEVPFVRLLFPLIIGILVAYTFSDPFIYSLWFILFFIIFGSYLVLLIVYKKHKLYRRGWLFGMLIHFYLAILAYGLTVHFSGRFDPSHFSGLKSKSLFVKIISEPKLSSGIVRFESEVIAVYSDKFIQNSRGKLLIALRMDTLKVINLNYGDIFLIPAKYEEVESSYNPGEFDYKSYLKDKQIYFQIFLQADQVKNILRNAGNPIISFALSLRQDLVKKFYRYIPDQEASSLASTLILGYRADLNKDLIEAYSKTGTMHILSVSGMHVGIVFLVLSFLLKPMNRTRKLILIRAIIIITLIWFYSLLTGFSPSVCRSALMLSFVVLGKAMNKNQNTYNLIAISAFFLLLYDPYYLFDVGFQLSYLAVTGLVYFHPIIYNAFYIKNKLLDHVWSYCALSIAAQLATFPLSLYYFHQFPMYFLISNLLIVLPVAVIMYAGIAFSIIPYPLIIHPLGKFLNWLINFTNGILYKIEQLPFSAMEGIWISNFEYWLISSLVISFVFWHSYRNKISVWLAIFICFILAGSFSLKSIQNFKRQELIFFSLRKNTAIAYLHQGRSIIITDIKPSDKLFNYSIKPSISSRGINESIVLDPEQQFSGINYWSDSDFMQFGNFRILRWRNEFNNLLLNRRIEVDMLLLSKGAAQELQYIKERVDFKTVIIDSSNPEYKIKAWLREAKNLDISCISLKKYPAYIVKL